MISVAGSRTVAWTKTHMCNWKLVISGDTAMTHAPTKALNAMKTLRRRRCRARGLFIQINRLRPSGRLALQVTLLFLLVGCGRTYPSPLVEGTPQPLSCSIFTDSRMREFRFGVDTPTDVASAAFEQWGVGQDQLAFDNLYGGDLSLKWKGSDGNRRISYWAYFGSDRHLRHVEILWSPPATLAQVIRCLGDPDYYNAHYGSRPHEAPFELVLWYSDEGIFVAHDYLTISSSRTPLKPAQKIDGFHLVEPNRPELTLPGLLPSMIDGDRDNPGIQAYVLCLLREWPGSIEAVEATGAVSYDDNTRCKSLIYW